MDIIKRAEKHLFAIGRTKQFDGKDTGRPLTRTWLYTFYLVAKVAEHSMPAYAFYLIGINTPGIICCCSGNVAGSAISHRIFKI